jgi:hypothetical protein
MKKYLLCGVASVLLLGLTQPFAQKQVDIGLKAGLCIPNLTSADSDNPINSGYSSRVDVDAAILVEIYLTRHFSLQPQLEYSSQGGKKSGSQAFPVPSNLEDQFPPGQAPTYLYANYRSEARLNYLLLPVLAKWRFDLGHRLGGYIAAGPFAALLLNATNRTRGSSMIYLDPKLAQVLSPVVQSFDADNNISNDLHRVNTGISGHLGIDYRMMRSSIFIEAGGNYGFVNIQEDPANGKNQTGAAIIQLGYQFRFW